MTRPRVRFAPSPTGYLHIGGARTALFNWLFARHTGGVFLLRIEDTDTARNSQEAVDVILTGLRWLGLDWDEGPLTGSAQGPSRGDCGPYFQSGRSAIYQKRIQELRDRGLAYDHDGAVKFRMTRDPVLIPDLIVGDVTRELTDREQEDPDFVIVRRDGQPVFHLVNVIDDLEMGITHVIRGEEWITSTPKHVLLYQAFGWDEPAWHHMPLLRNPDRSKISKRKNPVSLDYYRDAGFFPEALLNFLALMGFAFGGDREKFTLAEMIDAFDFTKVSAGEPVFDLQKLSWLNGLYLREMPVDELLRRLRGWRLSDEYLLKLLPLLHQRMERMDQFIPQVTFFLTGDLDYGAVMGQLIPKTRDAAATATALSELCDYLEEQIRSDWTVEALEAACRGFCDKSGWKTKELFMTIRLAVTGQGASPPLFDTMAAVGKDLTRRRLRNASQALSSYVPPASAPAPAKK